MTGSDAEVLADLARRLERLRPSHRDPEAFFVERSEIAAELRRLARAAERGHRGVGRGGGAEHRPPQLQMRIWGWPPEADPTTSTREKETDITTATIPLPAAATVRLREDYVADRKELAECDRVDKCGDWVDRAAALASYAKEVKDQALEAMAQRIGARAIRRAGQLLRQVEPGPGTRDGNREAGAHTPSQGEVAKAAGFSDHQTKQALRVAAVPAADFERQVESPTPPTVTELAWQGKRARRGRPPVSSAPRPIVELKGHDPEEINRAVPFIGAVEDALGALEMRDLDAVPLLPPNDRARALNMIGQIDTLTNRILVKMSEGKSMPRRAP